mgnify:CR=1 FL=1
MLNFGYMRKYSGCFEKMPSHTPFMKSCTGETKSAKQTHCPAPLCNQIIQIGTI